jgi:PAS domain S-box-containing protein
MARRQVRQYGRVVMQRDARPGHTSTPLSARIGDTRHANLRILPPPRSALPPGAADALVLARIHDAVFATDLENRVTFWAPSAEQLFGYPAASAVGRPFGELIPFRIDALQADPSDLQATVAAGQTWRGEGSCRLPDGRELWVESTVNPIVIDGRVIGSVSVSRDMTAKRRAAEGRRAAERALRVLSAVNRAVVRASDEAHLVHEVCQQMVSIGGYRLAWVGYAEEDAARSVRPIAAAGVDLGYVSAARLTWADEPRGQVPVGVAIRTGRPDVVRDATDPRIGPWREDALRRGYGSVAALPLKDAGRPFGALAVYAPEPDAFGSHELDLLAEAAGDLAYGIGARRTRDAEARAAVALRTSEERFRLLAERSSDIIYRVRLGPPPVFEYVSPAAERLTGFSPDEVLAHPEVGIYPGDPTGWPDVSSLAGSPQLVRRRRKDGTTIWLEHRLVPARDAAGTVIAVEGTARDVTSRVVAESALAQSEARYRAMVDTLSEGIVVRDGDGRIVASNPAGRSILGLKAGDEGSLVIAGPGWQPIHPDGSPFAFNEHPSRTAVHAGTRGDDTILGLRGPSGELRWLAIRADALVVPGVPSMTLEALEDITERRAATQARLLETELRAALVKLSHTDTADNSPDVTARLLCETLVQIGGVDGAAVVEWAAGAEGVILAAAGRAGFSRAGQAPLTAEQTLALQRRTAGGPWADGSSRGGADWIRDALGWPDGVAAVAGAPVRQPGLLLGVLLLATRDAELATRLEQELPIITETGASASLLLGPDLGKRRHAGVRRAALEHVLASRAFHPVFQPIVDLRSREIVGYEALTRFDSGRPPDQVFAEAWEAGLGPAFEHTTLKAAVAQAVDLPPGLWLDLNVSPRRLADPGPLRDFLEGTGRPLVLEITEHEAVADYAALRAAIEALGPDVRVAVDDAGVGVANFGHIVELRPDLVKIDISLVRRVNAHLGRQALVVGLVHFARSAGFRLVGEGIETQAEARTLAALGVDYGQGFLFGRPEPCDAMRGVARTQSRRRAPSRSLGE